MKDKLRELAGEMRNELCSDFAQKLEAILDADGDGGAVGCPELWIEFTDDGQNIRLWTRNGQQAAEEISEGRKLLAFYARPPAQAMNEQSGISGQFGFRKGLLEGLSMAKSECDNRVFALDGGDNQFRREATASQCAEAIRLVYARIFREIYPLPVIGTGDALQTLESFAMSGGELCGDDVPRFRALIDRIAPISHPARSGVARDEDVARMDWLVSHDVEVRDPQLHGSVHLFTAQTTSDEEDEFYRTSLREQIDSAIQGERHER